ncbi:CBM96 family carbohydrate-binding protein [Catelliglobosispora koreensis]|uniref:CBM96 family carbohydrate-binding protein n=1 Tax=Catelliglobosispora koreensis TaxID=129052 RepID=UPI000371B8CF|nr:DNRLRE domain-containing protein [Catelliglobosispora koreensis]
MRAAVNASLLAVVATTLVAVQASPAQAATYDTTLVSRAAAAADAVSSKPVVSADGRYIAFVSDADNLSTEDDNSQPNIFVRDTVAGVTTLVNRADGMTGAAANGPSGLPSITPDGRYVAFESKASNLSTEDNDTCLGLGFEEEGPCTNVFVRDLIAGTTTYASRAGSPADGGSYTPSISADGQRVAFTSVAHNLSNADNNFCVTTEGSPYPCTNFFVRDLAAGTTTYIARGQQPFGIELPCAPKISGNGRYVAFDTDETLLPGLEDNNAYHDVMVYDTQSATITYASRAEGINGPLAQLGPSVCPSISADGRHVAFTSEAHNLSNENVDGNTINIYVRDMTEGHTYFASRADGATGAAATLHSHQPSISADGRYVTFVTAAQNLSSEDTDICDDIFWGVNRACSDIFVRDTQAHSTAYVSRATGPAGAAADTYSWYPAISGDGKMIAFESSANNLSTEDSDAFHNIFVRDWGAGIVAPAVSDLSVTMTASATAVAVGSNVTFTVRVTNGGPAAATGVVVTDPLPPGISFISATVSQGSYAAATGVWSVGNIGVAANATLTLTGQVTTSGIHTNTAQISASGQSDPDSVPGNNNPAEDDQTALHITATAGCPTTATRTADYDAWITRSWANTNFGKDTINKVRSKLNADARTLVHFGLPALPAGCKVTSAKLRMYEGTAVTGRTLRVTQVTSAWTETGVTWNNQPPTTGTAATASAKAGWVEWTVTTQVAGLYTTGNRGLQIRDAAEGAAGYEQRLHSRENVNKPTLIITYGAS